MQIYGNNIYIVKFLTIFFLSKMIFFIKTKKNRSSEQTELRFLFRINKLFLLKGIINDS
jgi:hypothetical protein